MTTLNKKTPTNNPLSRHGLLSLLGAQSAIVLGGGVLAACGKSDDTGASGDCPGDTVGFEGAITGEITDGTATDYSPSTGVERTAIPSACWQCVCRDGIVCFVEDGKLCKIEGNPKALKTRGKICAKGQGGIGQVYDPDRLLFPMPRPSCGMRRIGSALSRPSIIPMRPWSLPGAWPVSYRPSTSPTSRAS